MLLFCAFYILIMTALLVAFYLGIWADIAIRLFRDRRK